MTLSKSLFSAVRAALRHLHDPIALRANPLVRQLDLQAAVDPCARLRRLLTDEIEAMEPGQEIPAHSRAWRTYEVLLYRYIEETPQQQVADQLGIGVRHLRREEHHAIEVLAHRIAPLLGDIEPEPVETETPAQAPDEDGREAVEDNLQWLAKSASTTHVDLSQQLRSVVSLLGTLAERYDVRLVLEDHGVAHVVKSQPVVVRQIMVNLLTLAIGESSGSSIQIEIVSSCGEERIEIVAGRGAPLGPLADTEMRSLDLSQQLAESIGASVGEPVVGQPFAVRLTFEVEQPVSVLVIDDNEDAHELLKRFVSGTRYRLVATSSPSEVQSLAAEVGAQVILIDVMMPEIDGWQLLHQLQNDPRTADTPIIVCTILPQEELAISLGAAAYLHKPFGRATLLRTLESCAAT